MMNIDWQSLLAGANPSGNTGGVNRGAPAVAPQIPIPQNQNMTPGGYMQQAMKLSGVPSAPMPTGAPNVPGATPPIMPGGQQISPQILQYLQALMGNPAQLQGIMQALRG